MRRHNPTLERFLDEALADLAKESAEMDRIIAEINKPDPETDKSIKFVLPEIDL
ncbi:hypothetical protein [Floridanema evergladense]|uniref:Uncharacterized protein n=1 Tax=Floridaenema evergladense BLCC-F167 TaxID=3153639 RepID=A0ABV4WGA7_9CYAN